MNQRTRQECCGMVALGVGTAELGVGACRGRGASGLGAELAAGMVTFDYCCA